MADRTEQELLDWIDARLKVLKTSAATRSWAPAGGLAIGAAYAELKNFRSYVLTGNALQPRLSDARLESEALIGAEPDYNDFTEGKRRRDDGDNWFGGRLAKFRGGHIRFDQDDRAVITSKSIHKKVLDQDRKYVDDYSIEQGHIVLRNISPLDKLVFSSLIRNYRGGNELVPEFGNVWDEDGYGVYWYREGIDAVPTVVYDPREDYNPRQAKDWFIDMAAGNPRNRAANVHLVVRNRPDTDISLILGNFRAKLDAGKFKTET